MDIIKFYKLALSFNTEPLEKSFFIGEVQKFCISFSKKIYYEKVVAVVEKFGFSKKENIFFYLKKIGGPITSFDILNLEKMTTGKKYQAHFFFIDESVKSAYIVLKKPNFVQPIAFLNEFQITKMKGFLGCFLSDGKEPFDLEYIPKKENNTELLIQFIDKNTD